MHPPEVNPPGTQKDYCGEFNRTQIGNDYRIGRYRSSSYGVT